MSKNNLDDKLFNSPKPLPDILEQELEAWVVNSVKVNMIRKLDNLLETEGKVNSRQLFLVPVFSITELTKRVEKTAPELKTLFYRELTDTIEASEKKFIG